MMIQVTIHQEYIIFVNIYSPNLGVPKYKWQLLTYLKKEIHTTIAGNFNMPLTPMDRTSRQKVNKDTPALNDTSDQMNLIDIYTTSHPKKTEYIFFSNAHETVSRIYHMLGHKTSLNIFKMSEIT